MKILVDTREILPLAFKDVVVERKKLDVGDYMAVLPDGSIPPISFERKSLSDLYGTMTRGYKRFKREVARAKESNTGLIVIVEGSISDVWAIDMGFSGQALVKKLFTLRVRYKLETVFCEGRVDMARYIQEFFAAVERNMRK